MKKSIPLFFLFLFGCYYAQEKTPNSTEISTIYTCPMHPEVESSVPGKCPKCGMDLVEINTNKTIQEEEELKPNHSNGKVNFEGNLVHYDLYVSDTLVNYTGKQRRAIAINGQIPAPVLYFTEGDTAEIHVHNRLKNESTGLHWHGVMVENKEDGVMYLTQMPIKPGEDYVYRFKVSQNGTYWYHSHHGMQEQIGMYGMLIFKKRNQDDEIEKYKKTFPIMLSEWSDDSPEEIMRRLHTDQTDWYAIKKSAVQSYSEAIATGNFWTKFKNEWKRMEAMDISDVYYQKFLLNGKSSQEYHNLKAGDKIRLQIANGGASTYFWLNFSGGKIKVIANDGNPVQPVEVDRLITGVSETYDIEIEIPENGKSYEFRATAEDRSGHASLWLGSGQKNHAKNLEKLMLFKGMESMNKMMKMSGDMKPMNMEMGLQQMDMNAVMYPEISQQERENLTKHMEEMMSPSSENLRQQQHSSLNNANAHNTNESHYNHSENKKEKILNYGMLESTEITSFPSDAPIRELNFVLEGNMSHYLWTLDNKTVTETDKILIKKGEIVRIKLYNNSMMRHPMHLHGHDFRVLNAYGDYAPMKNVLDIMPMETNIIEFPANQDGDWFFHCHILYHMMAGMGRIFSYENSSPNPNLSDPKEAWKMFLKDNRMSFFTGELALESRSVHTEAEWSSTRYVLNGEWHSGYREKDGYEAEFKFGRYLGKFQWAMPYIGFQTRSGKGDENRKNWWGQNVAHNKRNTFVIGMQYVLPWLITADANVDQNGKVRLQLQREGIPISPRMRGSFMVNTDKEYRIGLKYILQKWLSVLSHYDSDLGWSAGFTFTY